VGEVAGPVVRVRQEVKNGTVVPDVNAGDVPVAGHVRLDPGHAARVRAQSRSGSPQGCGGNVEDADTTGARAEDKIDEAGIPTPNVNLPFPFPPAPLTKSVATCWFRRACIHSKNQLDVANLFYTLE
jgi:hypothetical protein